MKIRHTIRTSTTLLAAAAVFAACGESPIGPENGSDGLTTPVTGVSNLTYGQLCTSDNFFASEGITTDFGVEINDVQSKSLPLTVTVPGVGDINLVSSAANGSELVWTSDIPMSVVSVRSKSAPTDAFPNGRNLDRWTVYDPPSTGDTAVSDGNETAIQIIAFCFNQAPGVEIEKTVETSYDIEYDWEIVKTAVLQGGIDWLGTSNTDADAPYDQADTQFDSGVGAPIDYTLTLTPNDGTPVNINVGGTITVTNLTPGDLTILGVSDVLYGMALTGDELTCPDFETTPLPAGGQLQCTYSKDLDELPAEDGENFASVNIAESTVEYDGQEAIADGHAVVYGSGTVGGDDPDATTTEDVVFGDPANYLDKGITVSDDNPGFGDDRTFNLDDLGEDTFFQVDYPYTIVEEACGEYEYTNTATVTENDTGDNASDAFTVNYEVVGCDPGVCTYTQGYWKTHNDTFQGLGGPPTDPTWELVGEDAEGTDFYGVGSWYEVFQTPPQGDKWYSLAHQYMAAKLNTLNGSDAGTIVPDDGRTIGEILSAAEAILAGGPGLKGKDGNEAGALAEILDAWNNGLFGDGHCG